MKTSKTLILLSILVLLGVGTAFIQIPGSVNRLEYFKDSTNQMGIEDVLSNPKIQWQLKENQVVHFTEEKTSSYWLKIPWQNDSSHSKDWILEASYSYIQYIDFYRVSQGKTTHKKKDQFYKHSEQSSNRSIRFTFPFTVAANEKIDIYINVRSSGLLLLPLVALDKDNYKLWRDLTNFSLGLFFGYLAALFIYNLSIYLVTKDKSYLYYVGFQAFLFVFHILYTGIIYKAFPELKADIFAMAKITYATLMVAVIYAAHFVCEYMFLKRNLPGQYKLQQGLNWTGFIFVMLMPLLPISTVANGTLVLVSFNVFLLSFVGRNNSRFVNSFLFAWGGLYAFTLINLLGLLNVIPSNFISVKLAFIGILWEATFLSIALGDRIRDINTEREKIKNALTGNTSKVELNSILEQPHAKNYHVSEEVVSIMFIDIVAFSMASTLNSPKVVFSNLSGLLNEITEIIYSHKGTIDRSLGDGILCFFGGRDGDRDHAKKAVSAASQIQELATRLSLNGENKDNIVMPIRIGINTDKVLIGNLGGDKRVDFTMIGDGVNFASRLEQSCNPYKIMIGAQTLEHLPQEYLDNLKEIYIRIKFHHDFIKAYELNIFEDSPKAKIEAESKYYKQFGWSPQESRTILKDENSVQMIFALGTFKVVNFSKAGFGVVSDVFVGRSAVFEVELRLSDPILQKRLDNGMLSSIFINVIWSRASKDGKYKHGLKMTGLNDSQLSYLHLLLTEIAEDSHRFHLNA